MMYGLDVRYAATRINNTIIRRLSDNCPVLVSNVYKEDDNPVVKGLTYLDGEINIPMEDLTVKEFSLGFINMSGGQCHYMMRQPKRRDWRQGLRAENTILYNNFTGNARFRMNNSHFKSLHNIFNDKYPELHEVKKYLDKQGIFSSRAFSKEFKVNKGDLKGSKNMFLHYKFHEVGVFDEENFAPSLYKRYEFLQEKLDKVIV